MKYELKTHVINGANNTTIMADVIGYKDGFPILEIPMMPDEMWNELAKRKSPL